MSNNDKYSRANLRFGWVLLVVFASLGLLLESLHLFKTPFYFEVHIRRELWTFAHAHGTLLALVNIVFGLYAGSRMHNDKWRGRASIALRTAALLMPAGFFLGGIGNPETDPSIPVILVPIGAVLLIYAAAITAASTWHTETGLPNAGPNAGPGGSPDTDQNKKPSAPAGRKKHRRS